MKRRTSPIWAAIAALGILVAAAFTLRAVQVSFFGATDGKTAAAVRPYAPITLAEKSGALLLIGATVLIGLKPDLLLNWIIPSLQSPLFQAALKGGTP